MRMKWDGVTPELYDKMRKVVNWEGNPPEGAVFHIAAFKDNVLYVTDIWESENDFNNFSQNRLMPKVAEEKEFQGEPQIEILPIHAIFAPVLERVSA